MTVTEAAPVQAPGGFRDRKAAPVVALGVVTLILVLSYAWVFIKSPSTTAPTRDPAWYTWRTDVIMKNAPKVIVEDWGPFRMFSGGYRVSTPVFGAELQRVAGVGKFSFTVLLAVFVPILASMAVGLFAWKHRRDPLALFVAMLAAGAMFLTTPYVGYMDNLLVIYVLCLMLPFLEPARTSWGARSALFILGLLAAFTHPTTSAIFGISLLGIAFVRFITAKFSVAKMLNADGPSIIAVGSGMMLGIACWVVGIWGFPGNLKDAALPPPYTQTQFVERLKQWVGTWQPGLTVPLILVAVASVIILLRRNHQPADWYSRISIGWLLPLVGLFGWMLGKSYPYYRFMNATAAWVLLTGMGAWALVNLFLKQKGVKLIAGGLGAILVVGSLGWMLYEGATNAQWKSSPWIDARTQASLASVQSYVASQDANRPIVFVIDAADNIKSWGWSKTFSNMARAGLSGDQVDRSLIYFGEVSHFLDHQPTHLSDKTYNKVSNGFFRNMNYGLGKYSEPPIVLLVRYFNAGTPNEQLIGQTPNVPLGPDVSLVVGSGSAQAIAPVDQSAAAAAQAAGTAESRALAEKPGLFSHPLHSLRNLAGLLFLIVLPGAVAAKWFELEDWPSRIVLVPGLSFALVALAGVFLIAVTRGPFSTVDGWAAVALAVLVAAGLHVLARRRQKGEGKVGPALNGYMTKMFAPLSIFSFAALMGTQFVAQMGDGVVQGSLMKAIAFSGKKGFDITVAPSSHYVLTMILLLYIPYTFISPFIGAAADRFDRKSLLVWSNVLRAGLVALAGLALLADKTLGDTKHHPVSGVVLIVVVLVTLACTRVLLLIKSAGLPVVLGGKDLMQGNAVSQAGGAVFQVLGAGMALVFTKFFPAGFVALGGAGLYVVAAVVARNVQRLEIERAMVSFAEGARRVFRDIWEGLVEVARRPAAAFGVTSFLILRTAVFGFVAIVSGLEARMILGGKADKTAVYVGGASAGLGAAVGLMLAGSLRKRTAPHRLLLAAMGFIGLAIMVFGGITTKMGFAGLAVASGLGFFVGKIAADTITQQALPDEFRGRGFALFDIMYNLGWILPAVVLFFVYQDSHSRIRVVEMSAGVVFLGLTAVMAAWARRIRSQLRSGDSLSVE